MFHEKISFFEFASLASLLPPPFMLDSRQQILSRMNRYEGLHSVLRRRPPRRPFCIRRGCAGGRTRPGNPGGGAHPGSRAGSGSGRTDQVTGSQPANAPACRCVFHWESAPILRLPPPPFPPFSGFLRVQVFSPAQQLVACHHRLPHHGGFPDHRRHPELVQR